VIFLTELTPSNLYSCQLMTFLMNSIFEGWESNNFFKIIFDFSLIIVGIAIVIYLLKLVFITIRLFQGFWASLEDED
jgi:hypothetical protein